jgi:hypothetical protein
MKLVAVVLASIAFGFSISSLVWYLHYSALAKRVAALEEQAQERPEKIAKILVDRIKAVDHI